MPYLSKVFGSYLSPGVFTQAQQPNPFPLPPEAQVNSSDVPRQLTAWGEDIGQCTLSDTQPLLLLRVIQVISFITSGLRKIVRRVLLWDRTKDVVSYLMKLEDQ